MNEEPTRVPTKEAVHDMCYETLLFPMSDKQEDYPKPTDSKWPTSYYKPGDIRATLTMPKGSQVYLQDSNAYYRWSDSGYYTSTVAGQPIVVFRGCQVRVPSLPRMRIVQARLNYEHPMLGELDEGVLYNVNYTLTYERKMQIRIPTHLTEESRYKDRSEFTERKVKENCKGTKAKVVLGNIQKVSDEARRYL